MRASIQPAMKRRRSKWGFHKWPCRTSQLRVRTASGGRKGDGSAKPRSGGRAVNAGLASSSGGTG
jgi:hypothetical protein